MLLAMTSTIDAVLCKVFKCDPRSKAAAKAAVESGPKVKPAEPAAPSAVSSIRSADRRTVGALTLENSSGDYIRPAYGAVAGRKYQSIAPYATGGALVSPAVSNYAVSEHFDRFDALSRDELVGYHVDRYMPAIVALLAAYLLISYLR